MSATPPDSRPSSPTTRPPRRQLEDETRKPDKNQRRYATGIERALASFDPAKVEWPDYISFLGRLLKAVQNHPPTVDTLPHKTSVANRLSQCLRPSLPSGVHQKALEVYAFIFTLVGQHALGLDLPVYLPGLSGVLEFASLSLRPSFLSLVETHIVPLKSNQLRPALRALILALLPGLEEHTAEDFERTLGLIDKLKHRVNTHTVGTDTFKASGDEYFWQCFFLASISSRTRRQGALEYLVKRLPKLYAVPHPDSKGTRPDDVQDRLSPAAEATVKPEPGLIIRCLAAGLEDDQILVQRGFLDLLLSHLPLTSPVLVNRVSQDDLIRLVSAATTVVARRDMSLNRRLWSWFLGPEAQEANGEDDGDGAMSPVTSPIGPENRALLTSEYFENYGLTTLVNSLLRMLNARPQQAQSRSRPFRVCLSLMDRWEVGSRIIPHIFIPAMINISEYHNTASKQDFQDVLRSASSFFDGVESGVIWAQLAGLGLRGMTLSVDSMQDRPVDLALFILGNFNVREEDMLAVHAPLVTLFLLGRFNALGSLQEGEGVSKLQQTYALIEILATQLPQQTATNTANQNGELQQHHAVESVAIDSIWSYYGGGKGPASNASIPLHPDRTSAGLLSESTSLLIRSLRDVYSQSSIAASSNIFTALASRLTVSSDHDFSTLIQSMNDVLISSSDRGAQTSRPRTAVAFPLLHAVAAIVMTIVSVQPSAKWRNQDFFLNMVNRLVHCLWDHLSPAYPRYHLEAVSCIWQLEDLLDTDNSVEASITSLFAETAKGGTSATLEHARRFAVLWTHTNSTQTQTSKRPGLLRSRTSMSTISRSVVSGSNYQERLYRPLFFLLDLGEQDPELEDFLRTWLDRLPNVAHVFQVIISRVRTSLTVLSEASHRTPDASRSSQIRHNDMRPDCLYYLQRLQRLLRRTSSHIWTSLRESNGEGRTSDVEDQHDTVLASLADTSFDVVRGYLSSSQQQVTSIDQSLQLTGLSILHTCLASPASASLLSLGLDTRLIGLLRQQLRREEFDSSVQAALLETTLAALRARTTGPPSSERKKSHRRVSSTDTMRSFTMSQRPGATVVSGTPDPLPLDTNTASDLTKCLQEGLGAQASIFNLENWVHFLIEVLPSLHATLFQCIIPLVETLCERIRHEFQKFNSSFSATESLSLQTSPESGLAALLNGLQYLLAMAHDKLSAEESRQSQSRTPEPPQGFFGNVAGVFAGEAPKARSATGNTRLTVVLCFQDALRICLSIWSWGAFGSMHEASNTTCLASYTYVSQRLRNQTRKLLDRMFVVEGLECLETLIVAWAHQGLPKDAKTIPPTISLLHVLDSSKPKQTMPALFNAIYSRTSPASIESNRQSTKTSDITDVELTMFLLEYTKSLDDDSMDEIWTDCMTFLRDVATNTQPHSHIMPSMLHFLVLLAEKVDKTNFGEQRKMRKDLGDLFLRLLTATLAIRSPTAQYDQDLSSTEDLTNVGGDKARSTKRSSRYIDALEVLITLVPRLSTVLTETDRLVSAVSTISVNVIAPLTHTKTFPNNLRSEHLVLLHRITEVPAAIKIWRKDLADLFMHSRIFDVNVALAAHLTPLAHRLALHDPDRLTDLCSRISPPTSAGIMFGVGANAARTDADRKTQINLRRIAFITLSAEEDAAVTSLAAIDEKISELLTATAASSPSAATRAEVFMLIRSLVLTTTPIHLAALWPTITSELQRAIASAVPRSVDFEAYNVPSLLQACKLLDLLVLVAPDEFQMHEWLFITDSIEAVHRPIHWEPVALVDDIAEELATSANSTVPQTPTTEENARLGLEPTQSTQARSDASPFKQPLLNVKDAAAVTTMGKEEFVTKILRPFFSRLSMHAYESAYSMKNVDMEGCKQALVEDLFDEKTIVG